MRSKSYKQLKEKIGDTAMSLAHAVAFLKENPRAKFDETVELHIALGVDAGKSEQMVRGNVVLPSGAPKQKRIMVFAADAAQQEAAKKAGAARAGGDDLIADIEKNGIADIDGAIATPEMMAKIAKIAKILGPKGLMPNPRTGTVTPDVVSAISELAAGKVSFKMDVQGNIHAAIAKAAWDAEKTVLNAQAVIDAVRAARPTTQKGAFFRKVVLKTTMSPAIKISM